MAVSGLRESNVCCSKPPSLWSFVRAASGPSYMGHQNREAAQQEMGSARLRGLHAGELRGINPLLWLPSLPLSSGSELSRVVGTHQMWPWRPWNVANLNWDVLCHTHTHTLDCKGLVRKGIVKLVTNNYLFILITSWHGNISDILNQIIYIIKRSFTFFILLFKMWLLENFKWNTRLTPVACIFF